MALSMAEANAQLAGIHTEADLINLKNIIAQLDITADGDVTVLYSGYTVGDAADGIRSTDIVNGMLSNGENIRVLDNTEAARFLNFEKNEAFANALDRIFNGSNPGTRGTAANQFLQGSIAPDGVTRIPDGAWDNVSGRFVDATVGEVRTLTGQADSNRVFAQTEVPRIIDNGNITHVDGISLDRLRGMGVSGALDAIKAKSAVDAALLKIATDADGNPLIYDMNSVAPGARVDTRDFFDLTPGMEGRAPAIETPMRSLAERITSDNLAAHAAGQQHLQAIKADLTATASLPGPENAALRASALKALDRLGIAGDIIGLVLVAKDANAAYGAGDTETAQQLVGDWATGFAGGLAGGILAAKLVGSALAPLYTTGPVGSIIAGGLTFLAGLAGGIIGEAGLKGLMANLKAKFAQSQQIVSPIVLDLDGGGIATSGLPDDIHFDHDANGFAESTGWINNQDGLLVRDLDGNGRIDSGRELFGSETRLTNGQQAANGYDALAELDSDHNGRIDAQDTAFASLKIWKDLDGDGLSSAAELITLAEAGVQSLATTYANVNLPDAHGNTIKQTGTFTKTDGSTGASADIWFATDKADTIATEWLVETPEVAALPDLQGFGNVRNLHQAMLRDGSGHLQSLVAQFSSETDLAARHALMTQILYAWVGVQNIAPASRGYITDARQLHVLEAFMGVPYVQGYGVNAGTPNTGKVAGAYPSGRKAANDRSWKKLA